MTHDVKLKSRQGYVQMMLTGIGGLFAAGVSKSLMTMAAPRFAPLQTNTNQLSSMQKFECSFLDQLTLSLR